MNVVSETISSRKRVSIVTSALPPLPDGIGDHTSKLAGALSQWMDVTVHTVRGFSPDAIPGVKVFSSFDVALGAPLAIWLMHCKAINQTG